MRQNEEQSDGADNNKQKNKANKHDKKRQRKPSPSENDPISLGERLRRWAREHDWYQGGHIYNHLVLKRAFLRPVRAAVNGFLSHGHVNQAMEVKGDFDALLLLTKRFDKQYRTGCSEDVDVDVCEFMQERIYAAIDNLAAILDNRDLKNDCSGTPPATAVTPFNPDHWMTFGQAAQILAVSKATISNWTTKGRIRDNSEKGQRRRVLKADVLLVKHEAELADLVRDAIEIRGDAQRIERRH